MSHSSPSGDYPKPPSPRPVRAHPGHGQHQPSSRPGTSGASHVEHRHTYPPIAPITDVPGLQYDTGTQTASRAALGMQSILNPPEGVRSTNPDVRSGAHGSDQTLLAPPIASPRSRKRPVSGSPAPESQVFSQSSASRRVLTPKSPGMRASSMGSRRNPPLNTAGSFQPLLGPEPRIYTAEPGSANVPSLPSLTVATRAPLPAGHLTDLPPFQARTQLGQTGTVLALQTTRSDSPSTSHTSLSQPDHTSPAFRYGTVPPNQQPPGGLRMRSGFDYAQESLHAGPESYQAGQPAYQMTLETERGPMIVPVELDLQQASKVADEKRKRNAGASARFRARRKEKEKEASQRIAELQQEIRDLREDRDFYRNERNIIRDFATSRLGAAQLPPRPSSPHTRRPAIPPVDLSREIEEGGRARSDSAPAAQRRRTGDYPPPFALQHSPLQQFPAAYPPPPPQPALPLPPPPAQQPGPFASPRQLPPGPPVPPPLGPRTQSYDPFRKDLYDRSWNPGR